MISMIFFTDDCVSSANYLLQPQHLHLIRLRVLTTQPQNIAIRRTHPLQATPIPALIHLSQETVQRTQGCTLSILTAKMYVLLDAPQRVTVNHHVRHVIKISSE